MATEVRPTLSTWRMSRRRRGIRRVIDQGFGLSLLACGIATILVTAGILYALLADAIQFFREVSIIRFLTEREWTPLFESQHFGILPLAAGTLLTTLLAMGVAVPLGLLIATYLAEYAPDRVRRVLKPTLEVLAGIPTVVYGYFALTFVSPLLRAWFFPDMPILNALSAGLVMGIMILPMVSSLSEDAMLAVPRALREAGYALGARRHQVALRVVIPAALSGIVAAVLLAIARALGETMIVAIAAGGQPNLTFNPLEGVQTMTAYMVQVGLGDVPYGSLEYRTLFAVGTALFAMTFVFNALGIWVVSRWRQDYR
ncbi:MAG: phosphate ABC transporter permease subunit PstC [Dehalococcoidia bacterium]|nr:phosphate ABC transporter permease subunit PstC [Dehalococcoidia bacterium]MDW8120005.1 phosphate ABC transporter permease subunit PstC [Chloroflexota bacterium]